MKRQEIIDWILKEIERREIEEQPEPTTQAGLIRKMRQGQISVSEATFKKYKKELIRDEFIDTKLRKNDEGKPNIILFLKPKGKNYLKIRLAAELKKGNSDFVRNLSVSKENLEKLQFQMELSGMTNPQYALSKILDTMFDIESIIWSLTGGSLDKRKTTTEEHLAVLRELGISLKPFLAMAEIPIPIDYVQSDDKITDDKAILKWIEDLREHWKKQDELQK